MHTIDGSFGEGGGQVLRSALALSLVTETPVRITRIRARRDRPGLQRQHLTAVRAAAAVGRAEVTGAAIGSRELVFRPRGVTPGEYTFDVGTAGSATLVLQTVLPALIGAAGPSAITLSGGTHNPMAPPFEFVERAFLPILERIGPRVTAKLEAWGFYPAGGGRLRVTVEPAPLSGLELLERGAIRALSAVASVANLAPSIADRELRAAATALGWDPACFRSNVIMGSHGPGNVILMTIESDHVTEVFAGFGEKGVRAEIVASRAAAEVREYLDAGVPVGPHLADQLLLPLALGGGGSFRTVAPTLHARTQADLIERMLGAKVAFVEESPRAFRVDVERGAR